MAFRHRFMRGFTAAERVKQQCACVTSGAQQEERRKWDGKTCLWQDSRKGMAVSRSRNGQERETDCLDLIRKQLSV